MLASRADPAPPTAPNGRRGRRWPISVAAGLLAVLVLPVPWMHVVSDDPPAVAWRLNGRLHVNDTPIDPPGRWSWLTVGRPQLLVEWLLERVTGSDDPPRDMRGPSATPRPLLNEPAAAATGLRRAGHDVQLQLLVGARRPHVPGLPASTTITAIDGIELTDRHAWERATQRRERVRLPPGQLLPTPEQRTLELTDGRTVVIDGGELPYEVINPLDVAPAGITAQISFAWLSVLPSEWFRELSLGRSHGMMVALTTYAYVVDADLAQGRHIAGTGGIRGDGTVTRVGGVDAKARAAHRAGADVLIVPASQRSQLDDLDLDGMTVVPVETLGEAVRWLERPIT